MLVLNTDNTTFQKENTEFISKSLVNLEEWLLGYSYFRVLIAVDKKDEIKKRLVFKRVKGYSVTEVNNLYWLYEVSPNIPVEDVLMVLDTMKRIKLWCPVRYFVSNIMGLPYLDFVE